MSRRLAFVVLVAAAVVRADALAAVRPCFATPRGAARAGSVCSSAAPSQTSTRMAGHGLRIDCTRRRSILHSSAIPCADDGDDSTAKDFKPKTMTIHESFAFFARFVVQTIVEKRAERRLGRENRRRLRDRLKRMLLHKKAKPEDMTKQSTTPKSGVLTNSLGHLKQRAGAFKQNSRFLFDAPARFV